MVRVHALAHSFNLYGNDGYPKPLRRLAAKDYVRQYRYFTLSRCYFSAAMAKRSSAQNSSELKTIEEVSGFMQGSYLHPQPDQIAEVIDALGPTGFVKPTNESVNIGFFSEVFAANLNGVPEWQIHIAKQDDRTKAILERAVSLSKTGGLLNNTGHSPQLNDGWWAFFFASGNPKFVDKIIDQLQYCDERTDEMLFFAGATAKWLLASSARTNPLVRSTLESAKAKASTRQRELISEVINEEPALIKHEMKETVQRQREAGKWKQRGLSTSARPVSP